MVVGVPRVGQGLGEVSLGQSVLVAVVGDPGGQLRQLAARGGELSASFFPVAVGGELQDRPNPREQPPGRYGAARTGNLPPLVVLEK
jgi:hypothetical protein